MATTFQTDLVGTNPSAGDGGGYKITLTQGTSNLNQLDWKLYYIGKSKAYRPYAAHIEIEVVNGSIKLYTTETTQKTIQAGSKGTLVLLPSGSYPDPAGYPSNGGTVASSGNYPITLTPDSTGACKIKVTLCGAINSVSDNLSPVSKTISYAFYTACGAPTSVTASGFVASTGGKFTVSWSGAKGGTNNLISGYYVYYMLSKDGTKPAVGSGNYTDVVSVSSTSSSGSYTFNTGTLSNKNGYKIICGVRTKGGAGSSYYSSMKTGGLVTVNTPPSIPTSSKTSFTVKESVTSYHPSITAGSTNDTGQTATIYYAADSSSGTYKQYTSSVNLTATSNGKSYYFKTYDGYDYSSELGPIKIIQNTKPSISVSAGSADITKYTVCGNSGDSQTPAEGYTGDTHSFGWAYAVQPTITVNKACTVKITLEYYRIGSTTTSSKVLSTITVSKTGKIARQIIQEQFTQSQFDKATGLSWRLKFESSDSIESGNTVYWPSKESDKEYYSLAPHPTTSITTCNNFSSSAVPGSTATHMWKEVRIKYPEDTSVNTTANFTIEATCEGASIPNTFTSGVSSNYRYLNVTLTQDLANATYGGKKITFRVTMTNSSKSIFKSFSASMYEAPLPTIGTPSFHKSSFDAFDKGAWDVGDDTEFGSVVISNRASCDLGSSAVVLCYAASKSTSVLKDYSGISTSRSNNTYISKTNDFKYTNLLDMGTSATWLAKTGSTTFYRIYKVTNVFGKTFYSSWNTATVNHNKSMEFDGSITEKKPSTGNTFEALNSTDWYVQGLKLYFTFGFKYYTNVNFTITIQKSINDGNWSTISTTTKKASSSDISKPSISNNELNTPTTTLTILAETLPNISDTSNQLTSVKYRVGIQSTIMSSAVYESTTSRNQVRVNTPVIRLTSKLTFDDSWKANVSGVINQTQVGYNINDWATAPLTEYAVYQVQGNTKTIVTAYFSGTTFTNVDMTGVSDWTQSNFGIAVQTTFPSTGAVLTGGGTLPIAIGATTFYLAESLYSVNLPTVALRKNAVVINQKAISNSKHSVELHPFVSDSLDRKYVAIYCQREDNSNDKLTILQVQDTVSEDIGIMKYTSGSSAKATIDFARGIINFG